jgi:hypothetical protein
LSGALNAIKTEYIRQNGLYLNCVARTPEQRQQVRHHQDPDRHAGFGMISLSAREAASDRPASNVCDPLLILC